MPEAPASSIAASVTWTGPRYQPFRPVGTAGDRVAVVVGAMASSTSAKVWLPVTVVNTTRPSTTDADAPPTGAPAAQTTWPSLAIVGQPPMFGIDTVPLVPSGPDMVSTKVLPALSICQRDTMAGFPGTGTCPCTEVRSPTCGAIDHVLKAGPVGFTP